MVKDADRPQPDGKGSGVWKRSQLYERMGDFQKYGLDVVFHERCTMTKMPNHKLEILRTGEKTLREMRDITRVMFHAEEMDLGMLRADLTADLEDVPVPWFRDHTIVAHKRTTREMGIIPNSSYMTVGKGIAETIYAGVKPNQIRIYNKTGERLARLHRENLRIAHYNKKNFEQAQGGDEMPLMTFEQMFGHSPTRMLTRVETQFGGKALERIGLNRMADLNRTPEMHPFKKIQFINDKQILLCRDDYTIEEWHMGLYLQSEAKAHGLAALKRYLYAEYGNKCFYRNWVRFMPFIQNEDRLCTYEKLQKEYIKSCDQQLYAA